MTTLAQRMAIEAHDRVEAVKRNPEEKYRQKYGTMTHKLPILIHTAGLAQALAFVESRDSIESRESKPHHQLLSDLAATIEFPNIRSWEELTLRSRTAELDEYLYLTRRVIAALTWYKRFVESILKIKQGDDADKAAPETEDGS